MKLFFLGDIEPSPLPRSATFMFMGVAGGPIERSCYSPHYVNTERDHERDYQQATLPQGRTAADGCKPPVTAVTIIGSGSAALVG